MAGDNEADKSQKTEAPSKRRIQQAAAQGQVALSREAVGFATLLLATLAALMLLPAAVDGAVQALRGTLSRTHDMEPGPAARAFLMQFMGAALPVAACAALGAVAATMAQTRGSVVASLLLPQLSRINPLAALGRMFGAHGWMELGRSILKIAVIGGVLAWVAGDVANLAATLHQPGGGLLRALGQGARKLLMVALGAFALLVIVDVLMTRARHLKQLRMTKREMREEMKESEGDPHIRMRQRMLRETRGRKRMLSAVPTATVIITNPTHYAVALVYEPSASAAPKIVAKGVDSMAARIREAAQAAGVPLLPNPPLARALYRLDVDTEIPPEHWEAVAEIIAFVLRRGGALPS